jgi:hypothetical protein
MMLSAVVDHPHAINRAADLAGRRIDERLPLNNSAFAAPGRAAPAVDQLSRSFWLRSSHLTAACAVTPTPRFFDANTSGMNRDPLLRLSRSVGVVNLGMLLQGWSAHV